MSPFHLFHPLIDWSDLVGLFVLFVGALCLCLSLFVSCC